MLKKTCVRQVVLDEWFPPDVQQADEPGDLLGRRCRGRADPDHDPVEEARVELLCRGVAGGDGHRRRQRLRDLLVAWLNRKMDRTIHAHNRSPYKMHMCYII